MGASGWDYLENLDTDVATTLANLHRRLFQAEYAGEYDSLEELWQDEEFMEQEGTHSILDITRIVTDTAPATVYLQDFGTIRPLAPERVRYHFGTARPTRRRYQELRASADSGRALDGECGARWTGVHLVLHEDDRPTAVAFWGWSGD